MSQKTLREYISRLPGVISIGLVAGLFYGLAIAIIKILNHDYINQQLYNISLFEIQSSTLKYSITFALIALITFGISLLITRIIKLKFFKLNKLNPKHLTAIIFLINLNVLYAVVCLFFYEEIILILKTLSLNVWLKNFISKPVNTFYILKTVFIPASFIFLLLITIIFSKLNLIANIINKLGALINAKQARHFGLIALVILISYNISIYLYRSFNTPEGPNVVLITIDTLRADHLGSYGYERDTTPNIDMLAERGMLFENAYAQASWTYPSMASMHTSLYPDQVGVTRFGSRINNKLTTLAEYMKNNFYNTYGVVSNIVVSEIFGFGQGFSQFEETYIGADHTTSEITTQKATKFIKKNKDDKFFIWIHYFDPHSYYLEHTEFDYGSGYTGPLPPRVSSQHLNSVKDELTEEDIEYVKDLYDDEISYTDIYIGKIIDLISNLGLENDTIIILTSDHGEEFMERSAVGHGSTLYEEVIKVPLIFFYPEYPQISGKRIKENVEIRNMAKTISVLTRSDNSKFGGYDLLDVDNIKDSNELVYSTVFKNHNTVLMNEWKLISNLDKNTYELYNLDLDPDEKINLYNSNQEDISQIRAILTNKLSDYQDYKTAEIKSIKLGDEDIKKLKALGYLQ